MSNQIISSDQAPKALGAYPHAKRAGNLLFLSKFGNYIDFDFEAQCRSVFENVKSVLQSSGATWNDLVDVTVFLTNMKRDFVVYNKIYAEYFQDVQPCRTTVEISSLPSPICIELKCIAYIEK
jgi:2-aminomuconate deaminase